ncbi:UDP-N-acetylenolpyruvoylglucosamine reductase [Kocuria sp. WRN011]|uniref:UDP-N-acetylenolpyruvoylglucosamine reductase n=1 Tax=Kocuria carniphila TaxID=262208 RepID=A0ABV3V5W2_9MICC|nr:MULTISPECIES: UDP-N-acetylmuramate dehydrogenase [Kocuria]PBB10046.1 UDP-N-acetylenolpyruvoylglucosamine reductase [Kocuria sp. WRN011]
MNAPRLADLTTTAVGGPATRYLKAETEQQLVQAVAQADEVGEPVLIVGGGSNILASDHGFEGTVVHVATQGIDVLDTDPAMGTLVTVQAGHSWDQAVLWSVEQRLAGLETLSGIPGTTGATPVQNVGAYGTEVSQTIENVHTWDRQAGEPRTFSADELEFSYRDSVLKRSMEHGSPRYVVLSVAFRLLPQEVGLPVRYGQLAGALGVEIGECAPLDTVRETVLRLRASKGMVLNPEDRDTYSTGSFFTNPIVDDPARLASIPDDAPRYPVLDAAGHEIPGSTKLSAAWLIDHSGFAKGFGLPGSRNQQLDLDGETVANGRAALSTKHTLAMTNRGGASSDDLAALARTVRDGVEHVFGVRLVPEPVLLGMSL